MAEIGFAPACSHCSGGWMAFVEERHERPYIGMPGELRHVVHVFRCQRCGAVCIHNAPETTRNLGNSNTEMPSGDLPTQL